MAKINKISKKELRAKLAFHVISRYISPQGLSKIVMGLLKEGPITHRNTIRAVAEYLSEYRGPNYRQLALQSLRKDKVVLRAYRTLKRERSISAAKDPYGYLVLHPLTLKRISDFAEGDRLDKIKSQIREFRERRQQADCDPLTVPLMERPKYSRILGQYRKNSEHRPTDSKKYFGIELEVIFNSQKSLNEFTSEILRVKRVTIATDGSLSSPKEGSVCREIKILSDDSFDNLKKVCDALKGKSFVNKTCGFHVHFDMRNHSMKESTLQNRIEPLLPVLKYLVPESRRSNRYCQLRVGGRDRYVAVNTQSLRKHGTVEVRLHSGTIEFKKIVNWITLWSKLIQSKRLNKIEFTQYGPHDSLIEIFSQLRLSNEVKEYYLSRYLELNPQSGSLSNDTEQTLTDEASA